MTPRGRQPQPHHLNLHHSPSTPTHRTPLPPHTCPFLPPAGISHVSYSGPTPYASNTALPITTGCSFNRSLWHATGNQIGREARAFMNVGNAFGTYWTPVLNTVRDPRE